MGTVSSCFGPVIIMQSKSGGVRVVLGGLRPLPIGCECLSSASDPENAISCFSGQFKYIGVEVLRSSDFVFQTLWHYSSDTKNQNPSKEFRNYCVWCGVLTTVARTARVAEYHHRNIPIRKIKKNRFATMVVKMPIPN